MLLSSNIDFSWTTCRNDVDAERIYSVALDRPLVISSVCRWISSFDFCYQMRERERDRWKYALRNDISSVMFAKWYFGNDVTVFERRRLFCLNTHKCFAQECTKRVISGKSNLKNSRYVNISMLYIYYVTWNRVKAMYDTRNGITICFCFNITYFYSLFHFILAPTFELLFLNYEGTLRTSLWILKIQKSRFLSLFFDYLFFFTRYSEIIYFYNRTI